MNQIKDAAIEVIAFLIDAPGAKSAKRGIYGRTAT